MRAASTPAIFLRGHRLAFAHGVWLVLAVFVVGLFAVAIPARYHELATTGSGERAPLRAAASVDYAGRAPLQLDVDEARALDALGLSLALYAFYQSAVEVAFALFAVLFGVFIFWRKHDDWIGMLASFSVLMAALLFTPMFNTLAHQPLVPGTIVSLAFSLGAGTNVLLWFFFPDGRFVPRGARLPVAMFALWVASWPIVPSVSPFALPPLLSVAAVLVIACVILFAQVYRYYRVSNAAQRQQTKWVVAGLIGAVLLRDVLGASLDVTVDSLGLSAAWRVVYDLLYAPAFYFVSLWPILAIGIAILRYRLWEIDILINRALVYSVLSGMLALIYFASVLLLQRLTRIFTGEAQDELATVVSTLVIAALFIPLRGRVQSAIDRRFYRRKYDAAKTLQAFSTTVRDEVDLDTLSEDLLGVVRETMQPAQVSLWLKPASRTPMVRDETR
jgi:hypothetical protein